MKFVVKLLAACGLIALLAFGLLGGAYYYVNVRPVPFEDNPPEVVIKGRQGQHDPLNCQLAQASRGGC